MSALLPVLSLPLGDPAPVCAACGRRGPASEEALVRCNVRRFRERSFPVWRCGGCSSLHVAAVPELAEYYAGYPIRGQRLDYFLRTWYRRVLRRLVAAGLQRRHRILDHGCNQGLFLDFLREHGYRNCTGYDPFVPAFASTRALADSYDWVVSLDVIEHDADPRGFLHRLAGLTRPGGHLCIETPDAAGIDLSDPEEYLHALHAPYHVHILSRQALRSLAADEGLAVVAWHRRWYMDGRLPGTARGFFEPLMRHAGNDVDAGYERPRPGLFAAHPGLVARFLVGGLLPSPKTDHQMAILRRMGPYP
ncbi:MAG: class I SAM-dependent methyltransferase [Planctomycetes bacterium]|nr:class I SAM-dependent methyltransferase [Planctomycetota bacterium]